MANHRSAIIATELSKRYRRNWVLNSCSFHVPVGSIAALVGQNGAGKSTLMALAAGLIRPTSGSIQILGNQARSNRRNEHLAFLSQDYPLYRRFSVEEMLHFGRAMNPRWDEKYARRLTQEAGLGLRTRIDTLSGGQRARLALALALGRRPSVLMLDEPLARLDPLSRSQVMRTILGEVASTGITIVLSSHVISDVEDACDRILLLRDGGMVVDEAVESFVNRHRLLIGPARESTDWVPPGRLIESSSSERQSVALVDDPGILPRAEWAKLEVSLEELVSAYLRSDPLQVLRNS